MGAEELYYAEEEEENSSIGPNSWDELFSMVEKTYDREIVTDLMRRMRWLKQAYSDPRCEKDSFRGHEAWGTVRMDAFSGLPEDKSAILFSPANAMTTANVYRKSTVVRDRFGRVRFFWEGNNREKGLAHYLERLGNALREERNGVIRESDCHLTLGHDDPTLIPTVLERLKRLSESNPGRECCWSLTDVAGRSSDGGSCGLDVISLWSYWVIYVLNLAGENSKSIPADSEEKSQKRALTKWNRKTEGGKLALGKTVFDRFAGTIQRRIDDGILGSSRSTPGVYPVGKSEKELGFLENALREIFEAVGVTDSEKDPRKRLNLGSDWCVPKTEMDYTCAFDSLVQCFTFQLEYASLISFPLSSPRHRFDDWRVCKRWEDSTSEEEDACLFDRLSLFGGLRYLEKEQNVGDAASRTLKKGKKTLDRCAEYALALFANGLSPPKTPPATITRDEKRAEIKEVGHARVLGCQPLSLHPKYKECGGITMGKCFERKMTEFENALIELIEWSFEDGQEEEENAKEFGYMFGTRDVKADDSMLRVEEGSTLSQVVYWQCLESGRTSFDIFLRYVRLKYVAGSYKKRVFVTPEDLGLPAKCRSFCEERMEIWKENSKSPSPIESVTNGDSVSWAYSKQLQEQYRKKSEKTFERESSAERRQKKSNDDVTSDYLTKIHFRVMDPDQQQSKLAHEHTRFDVTGDVDYDRFLAAVELCKSQFHYDFPKALCREKTIGGSLDRAATFSFRSGSTNPEELMGMDLPQRFWDEKEETDGSFWEYSSQGAEGPTVELLKRHEHCPNVLGALVTLESARTSYFAARNYDFNSVYLTVKDREEEGFVLNDVRSYVAFRTETAMAIASLKEKCKEGTNGKGDVYSSYQNFATDIQLNPWGEVSVAKDEDRITCDLTAKDERSEITKRAKAFAEANGMTIEGSEKELLIKIMEAKRLVYTKKTEVFGSALGNFKFLDWLNGKRTAKRLSRNVKKWLASCSNAKRKISLERFLKAKKELKNCQFKKFDSLEKFGTCFQPISQNKGTGYERVGYVDKLLKEVKERGRLKHSLSFVGVRTLDDEIVEKTEKWIPKEMLDSSFFMDTVDVTRFCSSALANVQLNAAQFDAGDYRLDGEKTGGFESKFYSKPSKRYDVPKGWKSIIEEEEEEEERQEESLTPEQVQKKFCIEMFSVNRFSLGMTFEKKGIRTFGYEDEWEDAPLAVSHAQFNWGINRDHLFLGKTFQVQILSRPFKMLPAEDVYVDCLRVKRVKQDYCDGIIAQEHVSLLMEIKNLFHGVSVPETGDETKEEWSGIVTEKRRCETELLEGLKAYEIARPAFSTKRERNDYERDCVENALRSETEKDPIPKIVALYKRYFKVKRYKLVSLLVHSGSGTSVGGSGHFSAEGIASCAYGSSRVETDYSEHDHPKTKGPFPTERAWKGIYYDDLGILNEGRTEEARAGWCGSQKKDVRLPYGSDPTCWSFGMRNNVPCLDDSFAKLGFDVKTGNVKSAWNQKFKEDSYRVINVDFRSASCSNECKDPEGNTKKALERWRTDVYKEVEREEEFYEREIKPVPKIWKEHYGVDWIRPTMRYIYIKNYETTRISSLRYALAEKVLPLSS
jgi:hypothetical protein